MGEFIKRYAGFISFYGFARLIQLLPFAAHADNGCVCARANASIACAKLLFSCVSRAHSSGGARLRLRSATLVINSHSLRHLMARKCDGKFSRLMLITSLYHFAQYGKNKSRQRTDWKKMS